jgi:cysteine desulfurase
MAATIYLDNHATTPLDPRVQEAMAPFGGAEFGNPHSLDHARGRTASAAVDLARAEIAALIGADPAEIVFTSGAPESNNLAIQGALLALGEDAGLAISAIEHASVREIARAMAATGRPVTRLAVDRQGILDLDAAQTKIGSATELVSVILASNEIGTIQPIKQLAALCHENGVLLHSDAAQAVGKIPVNVRELGVDLLSLTAHKFHGPMGIGALYVRRGVALKPLFFGGQQQGGLRPGTLPLPLVVGFGAAAKIAAREMTQEAQRIQRLRDRLFGLLRVGVPGLLVSGDLERRLPGNLHISAPGIEAEEWLAAMPELALSTGAACASGTQEPSPVLLAVGRTSGEIQGSVRIGLGRFTSENEIDRAAAVMIAAAATLTSA